MSSMGSESKAGCEVGAAHTLFDITSDTSSNVDDLHSENSHTGFSM